jgi:heat shock protein HslJ
LFLALGLASCGADSLTGPSAIAGGVWKLQSLQRADFSILEIDEPERYTLEFGEAGALLVRADCNRCSGSYTSSGASLQVGRLACTLVACPADSHESEFLQVLTGATSHGVVDGVLTIDSTAGALRLER